MSATDSDDENESVSGNGSLNSNGNESGSEQEAQAQNSDGDENENGNEWDNDWDEINKKREEIAQLREENSPQPPDPSNNLWKDTHEKDNKVLKADNSKWDNDWDTINKQRQEIKAIKAKQRIHKMEAEEYGQPIVDEETQHKIDASHNKWKDTHESQVKASKAETSKWDNDWDTINKQRAEIKAIKDKQRRAKGKENGFAEKNKRKKETDKKFKNAHEKKIKASKADTSKWDNDWEKINAKRAEIKAIKEKKRLSKLQSKNDLIERNKHKTDVKFKSAHDKKPKKIAAKERVGTDWDKIEKQRAEIKAIKEKRRREKAEKEAAAAHSQSESITKSKKKKSAPKKKTKKKKPKPRESSSEEEYTAHETKFGNMHEKDNKVIKADNSKWDNDWDKINAKRAEIKAIKQKKRMSKLQSQNDLIERNKHKTDKKFKNAHDKKPKKITAKERVGTDWDKIEKQRAEIKAIKERRRREKAKTQNELTERNKHKTDKKFKSAHDKKPKKIAAKERVGTDWDKIEKQRAEIRAIKERRRREKEQGGAKKKKTTTFGNMHEQ